MFHTVFLFLFWKNSSPKEERDIITGENVNLAETFYISVK